MADGENLKMAKRIRSLLLVVAGVFLLNALPLFAQQHPRHSELMRIYKQAERLKKEGRYAQSARLYEDAVKLGKEVFGEQGKSTITLINNLAALYHSMGEYKKAEPLFLWAMATRKKVLGENNPSYATSLNNLGALYKSMGAYEKTEPLYLQAMTIRKKVLGEKHPHYAQSLNNLGELYRNKGAYEKAEGFHQQAMAIRKKVVGEKHPDYAQSLNNLALLYEAIGAYEKAEPLYLHALTIWKNVLGENHPYYAQSLNNLALLYYSVSAYKKAEPLYLQAMAIRKKILGEKHPRYATSLNNLAGLYYSMGAHEKAKPFFIQALEIRKQVFGEKHPDYAGSLNNLAGLYDSMGAYEKAEPLYLQSMAIWKKTLGEKTPLYAASLSNIGCLNAATGRYREAFSDLSKSLLIQEFVASKIFAVSSEKQRMNFMKTINSTLEIFLSLCFKSMDDSAQARSGALDALVRRQGMVLESMLSERRAARRARDPEVAELTKRLQDTKGHLSRLVLGGIGRMGASEYKKRSDQLSAQIDALEAQIARKSASFRNLIESRKVDTKALSAALPSNSAFVQFTAYEIFNFKAKGKESQWGRREYAALILRAGKAAPKLVPLGDAKQIEEAIAACRTAQEELAKKIGTGETKPAETRLLEAFGRVEKIVWRPVAAQLGDVRRVYLCPAGELNFISFSALPGANGRYLIEQYEITMISTGRGLLRGSSGEAQKQLIAFGAPNFGGESVLQDELMFTRSTQKSALRDKGAYNVLGRFSPLPRTQREAVAVVEMGEEAGLPCTLYTGSSATEARLKMTERPRVLYLATHGFFLSDSDWSKPDEKGLSSFAGAQRAASRLSLKQNPMLRSGLALAGANRTLEGKSQSGVDDGIVTAEEVAGLNLEGTNLVVLSACQTGLGKNRGGEGVLGLRRAFVMAGSEHLVMSLWSVSDKATQELLSDFYARYTKTGNPDQALREAQRAFLKQARKTGKRQNPFYWAAFVQTGIGIKE